MNPVYSSIIEQVTEQEKHRANIYKRPESLHKSISAFMPRDIRNFALQAPMRDARAIAAIAAKSRLKPAPPAPTVEMKVCRSCKQSLEIGFYNKHGKNRDGTIRTDLSCRTCHNADRLGKPRSRRKK